MKKYIFNDNKIIIASHNKGKVKEIKDMLSPLNIEVLSADHFKLKELKEMLIDIMVFILMIIY